MSRSAGQGRGQQSDGVTPRAQQGLTATAAAASSDAVVVLMIGGGSSGSNGGRDWYSKRASGPSPCVRVVMELDFAKKGSCVRCRVESARVQYQAVQVDCNTHLMLP